MERRRRSRDEEIERLERLQDDKGSESEIKEQETGEAEVSGKLHLCVNISQALYKWLYSKFISCSVPTTMMICCKKTNDEWLICDFLGVRKVKFQ